MINDRISGTTVSVSGSPMVRLSGGSRRAKRKGCHVAAKSASAAYQGQSVSHSRESGAEAYPSPEDRCLSRFCQQALEPLSTPGQGGNARQKPQGRRRNPECPKLLQPAPPAAAPYSTCEPPAPVAYATLHWALLGLPWKCEGRRGAS